MSNDAYIVLLNLEPFPNSVALVLLWRLKKDFKITKNFKIFKFGGDLGEL